MFEMLNTVAEQATNTPDINKWFVVGMGLGTVFVGLICIIVFCKILGAILGRKKEPAIAPAVPATAAPVENRSEIIAAVCAVAAEEMGTDISALRVLSFKKL